MLDVQGDSFVTQLFHEVRLPIPLQAGASEAPERPQNLIRLLQWSVVAPDQAAHLLEV